MNQLKYEKNIADLFIKYFNYCWIFGVCPFKFGISKETGLCYIRRNIFQTILFSWNVIQTCYGLIYWFYSPEIHQDRNISYFYKAKLLGTMISFLTFVYSMCRNGIHFKNLINYLKRMNGNLSREILWSKDIWYLFMLCALFLINQIFLIIADFGYHKWNFNSFDFYRTILLLVPMRLFRGGMDSLLLTTALVINSHLKSLDTELPQMNFIEGFNKYKNIRTFFKLGNKALEIGLIGIVFGDIPFIIFKIPETLQPKGSYSIVDSLIFGTCTLLFLIYSAWLNNKVLKVFEDWIFHEKQNLETCNTQFNLLLYQLNKETGFELFGFIKFSSGFLGGVIGLVLTFSVVFIQFDS